MATSTGLYATDSLIPYYTGFTNNITTEWKQIGTEIIGNVVIESIKVRQNDGLLVVGTHGTGVYSTNISNINQIFSNTSLINNTDLNNFKIFPNPTKEYLNIKSDIKIDKIFIHDISGKLVFEKNINELNIFKTKVNNLNKGTYLLTIIRDNKKETKQIIIN